MRSEFVAMRVRYHTLFLKSERPYGTWPYLHEFKPNRGARTCPNETRSGEQMIRVRVVATVRVPANECNFPHFPVNLRREAGYWSHPRYEYEYSTRTRTTQVEGPL